MHGAGFISGLIKQADGRIIVMPGGGIDDKNISPLKKMTTANEFHLSARMVKPSRMRYRNEFVIMSSEDTDEYAHDIFDAETFKKVRENAGH
jgi:copper homeostasis protein